MSTVFFQTANRKGPCLTYLLLETYSALVERHQDLDLNASEILILSLEACGQTKASDQDMKLILEEMNELGKSAAEKLNDPVKPAESKKKSFGSEYMKWVEKLNIEQVLLIISDYDFARACTYYAEVPLKVVDSMVELYLRDAWLTKQALLEASILGFGGDLGSSSEKSGDGGYGFESESDEKRAAAKLKSLGF